MKHNFIKFNILYLFTFLFFCILLIGCPVQESSSSGGSSGGNNTYTVSYNGNGNTDGSVPTSTSHDKDRTVTVAFNSGNLLKINVSGVSYKLDGWNTKPDGTGIDYVAGTGTFTITSDIILYAKWVPYSMQDIGPAGGYIFYNKGNYTGGWRYMEAAPEDCIGTGNIWGTMGTDAGADGTWIGDGRVNTINIVSNDPATNTAADICVNYSVENGGIIFDDWYLPSNTELNLMYSILHQNELGDFLGVYWSSSEINSTMAIGQYFSDGSDYNGTKGNLLRVRAYRMF